MSSYGRRVRSLKGSDRAIIKGSMRMVASTVFKDISFYRPPEEALLPNLRELHWTAHAADTAAAALLFVSPSVMTLVITIEETVSPVGYKALVQNLSGRLPGIEHFTLTTTHPAGTVVTELAECIQLMPRLLSMELPQLYFYEEILRAASQLQSLTSIGVPWLSQQVYDKQGTQFYFEEGWFQSIHRIPVDAHPQTFAAFLSASQYFHLTEVGLVTRSMNDPNNLEDRFRALASSCPSLFSLYLNLFSDRGEGTQRRPLTFANLHPLLSCSNLMNITAGHDLPMTFENSDFVEMGDAWPFLRTFDLCNDPYIQDIGEDTTHGTSLEVLSGIAEVMPRLEKLGLYFLNEAMPTVQPSSRTSSRLHNLQLLDVGLSPILQEQREQLAFFLGKACPFAEIGTGQSCWRVSASRSAEKEEMSRRKDCWTEVERLMKTFVRFEESTRMELKLVRDELHCERRERLEPQKENREVTAKSESAS